MAGVSMSDLGNEAHVKLDAARSPTPYMPRKQEELE